MTQQTGLYSHNENEAGLLEWFACCHINKLVSDSSALARKDAIPPT